MRRYRYPRVGLLVLWAVAWGASAGCTEPPSTSSPGVPSATRAPKTPNALAQAVLEALRSDDLEAYRALHVWADDGPEIIRRWAGGQNDSPFTEAWFGDYLESRSTTLVNDFRAVRAKGDGAGFDWDTVQIASVTTKNQPKAAATVTDIFVTLQAFGATYPITIDDCVHLSRGWAIVDGIRWTKQ